MRGLTKRDVERLLAVLDRPPADLGEEVAGLRGALADALGTVLELPAGLGFDELARRGAAIGGWSADRVAQVCAPASSVAVRDALWDLLAELNEHRGLTPDASATGSVPVRPAATGTESSPAAVEGA